MIPKIIHFIWIGGGEFKKSYEYSILSVLKNTTFTPILHTDNPKISIPGVTICIRQPPSNINYNKKYIAHLADIIRLDILYEYGGIYSDLDIIWLRNPTEHMKKKFVIGYTNKSYKILCNAVMIVEKGSQLLQDYRNYLVGIYPCTKYWVPANPYKIFKDSPDITFAEKKDFFPIRYNETDSFTFDDIKNSICVHLFCSMNDIEKIYQRVFADILSY